jgi:hypothetical protein
VVGALMLMAEIVFSKSEAKESPTVQSPSS